MSGTRKALVTGSTSGIGRAIADGLLTDGYQVIVHGRDAARCIRTREKLSAHDYVAGDLTTPDGVAAVAEAAKDVDVLVLNAGQLPVLPQSLLDTPLDGYDDAMALHCWSSIRLMQAAMPGMLERNDHGRVITIGTEATVWTKGQMAPYILSKHFALMVSRLADHEAHQTTVTSNAVIVGPTLTEGVASIGGTVDAIRMAYGELPAGRPAEPGEVAAVVRFLAARESVAIRGATVRADCGVIPTWTA